MMRMISNYNMTVMYIRTQIATSDKIRAITTQLQLKVVVVLGIKGTLMDRVNLISQMAHSARTMMTRRITGINHPGLRRLSREGRCQEIFEDDKQQT